jgi:stage II sporulation protein M
VKASDNMQKGRVLRLKSFGILEFLQKNYILIIILLFLILGILVGSFKFDSNETLKNYFTDQIENFLQLRINTTFNKVLFNSFFKSLAVLFLIFLLGASLFGVVTVPSAMFIKGFVVGGMSAFLYSQYGLKGVAFNSVIFIPTTLAFLVVLLLAGRESVKFSFKFSSLTLSKTLPQNLSNDFKDYSIKYLIFMVLTFAASVVDAVVTKGFIKNFSLI